MNAVRGKNGGRVGRASHYKARPKLHHDSAYLLTAGGNTPHLETRTIYTPKGVHAYMYTQIPMQYILLAIQTNDLHRDYPHFR